MINGELFNHNQFATPQILRSYAYLESLDKFDFQAKVGCKTKCRAGAWFGLQNEARLQLCASY